MGPQLFKIQGQNKNRGIIKKGGGAFFNNFKQLSRLSIWGKRRGGANKSPKKKKPWFYFHGPHLGVLGIDVKNFPKFFFLTKNGGIILFIFVEGEIFLSTPNPLDCYFNPHF